MNTTTTKASMALPEGITVRPVHPDDAAQLQAMRADALAPAFAFAFASR